MQGGESAASAIFGGALRSEVRARGAAPSANIQPFTMLHLDIHLDRVTSLADALAGYTQQETIQGVREQSQLQFRSHWSRVSSSMPKSKSPKTTP